MDQLGRALGHLETACTEEGLGVVMGELGIMGEARVHKSFDEQRAPDIVADIGRATEAAGQPWAAPSPATMERRQGSSMELLRDTGRMEQAVAHAIIGASAEIGIGVYYAEYQHGGTPTIPARPIVGIDDTDMDGMMGRVVQHLEAAVSR